MFHVFLLRTFRLLIGVILYALVMCVLLYVLEQLFSGIHPFIELPVLILASGLFLQTEALCVKWLKERKFPGWWFAFGRTVTVWCFGFGGALIGNWTSQNGEGGFSCGGVYGILLGILFTLLFTLGWKFLHLDQLTRKLRQAPSMSLTRKITLGAFLFGGIMGVQLAYNATICGLPDGQYWCVLVYRPIRTDFDLQFVSKMKKVEVLVIQDEGHVTPSGIRALYEMPALQEVGWFPPEQVSEEMKTEMNRLGRKITVRIFGRLHSIQSTPKESASLERKGFTFCG